MKDKTEIQRVHDMFVAVIIKEVDLGLHPLVIDVMNQTTHVLCWMLEHEHEGTSPFTELIKLVEDSAKERGLNLEDNRN